MTPFSKTKPDRLPKLFFLPPGVPYPAKFDLPTLWSDSTFELSWRVNCSTPIINYLLEFRELPRGKWVSLNVPGDAGESSSSRMFGSSSSSSEMEVHKQTYTLRGLKKDTSYAVRKMSILIVLV